MQMRYVAAMGIVAGATWAAVPAQAVTFNISSTGNPQADAGFAAAAQLWADRFNNDMTVNITAGFTPLGPGVLGTALSADTIYSYASVRSALIGSASSADDLLSTSFLQSSDVDLLVNRTSNNPNGSGSATPYLDNDGGQNNTLIRMSYANAKALGLRPAHQPGSDSSISFSSNFSFDFDRSDGITAGQYDFVGVAAHEIGHALGFISGVDTLELNSPPKNGPFNDNQFSHVSTLDLFRYSSSSVAMGPGVIDWTADARTKFFSIDGGTTSLATFSTGTTFGDGRQASHWKDHLSIGLLDPTLSAGELGTISSLDLRAFDVIGYTVVPEPAGVAVLAFGALALSRKRRRA